MRVTDAKFSKLINLSKLINFFYLISRIKKLERTDSACYPVSKQQSKFEIPNLENVPLKHKGIII